MADAAREQPFTESRRADCLQTEPPRLFVSTALLGFLHLMILGCLSLSPPALD